METVTLRELAKITFEAYMQSCITDEGLDCEVVRPLELALEANRVVDYPLTISSGELIFKI